MIWRSLKAHREHFTLSLSNFSKFNFSRKTRICICSLAIVSPLRAFFNIFQHSSSNFQIDFQDASTLRNAMRRRSVITKNFYLVGEILDSYCSQIRSRNSTDKNCHRYKKQFFFRRKVRTYKFFTRVLF